MIHPKNIIRIVSHWQEISFYELTESHLGGPFMARTRESLFNHTFRRNIQVILLPPQEHKYHYDYSHTPLCDP